MIVVLTLRTLFHEIEQKVRVVVEVEMQTRAHIQELFQKSKIVMSC